MGKSVDMIMLQHASAFLLGAAVLLVCIAFYRSKIIIGGHERSLETFALINATEANSNNIACEKKEVASFDDRFISRAAEVLNQTMVQNATAVEEAPFPDLLPLLERVATIDKTVIITSVNEAWATPNSLLDIFLEGFHIGEGIEYLLNHLIVVTLDPNALNHCTAVHPHCYLLPVDGKNFTEEKVFMSGDYIDLVWTKVKLQRRILELGYNFLFTDVDILWMRNPFKHITVYADLTTSSDKFLGDPDYIQNFPNTGFIFVKSTEKTIEMMNYWLDARSRYSPDHEQNIFNFIKADLANKLRVKIQYIDTSYCGGFCNHGNDLNKICTMHANCCGGLRAKLHDLRKIIEDWKFYMALPIEEERNMVHMECSGDMRDSVNMLQPGTRFLLAAAAAFVCITIYRSNIVYSGYEKYATQANSVSKETEVASFDDLLTSAEDVNQTMVPIATPIEEESFPDLLPLLKRVATDDKTVIITSVNEAWAKPNSLLDIFLEGFRIGEGIEHLLNHVIVVTLDLNALNHCSAVHPHCYLLTVDGMNFTSEKVFMSNDYINLVWIKVKLQKRILELGYNFLFTDVDILWLRNPFRHITVYADLTTSSDVFFGDPDNINNFPNTGFIYVKPTQKAIEMMNYWLDARDRNPPNHEQHIFNLIKADLVEQLKVKIQYIDTAYCGGFCNHGNDLNKICTMHANCCIGLQAKLHDLRKVIEDWKFYTALPIEERKKGWFTWRVQGLCMH
ncbi:hypothetical protein LUZ61_012846 [Rhynchospora tenuis]|uniref:Nucleotide-diphospho-sugar transferase domain-containing protein n=1 Tax=Rhynchospora tenuis TaxID=198213 RepID=A0AAD6A3N5_9POAL|nr:hypothetical protein LUZ61_012846 [Rhynchospora tenuis]